MFDKSDIFNIEQPHMTGKFIFAGKGCSAVTNITVPHDGDVLVLTSADMGSNTIEIDGMKIPVLAGDRIDCNSQPLIAVFSDDRDTTDLLCNRINISCAPRDASDEKPVEFKTGRMEWGDCTEPEGEGFKTVKSTFKIRRHSETLMNCGRIMAVEVDGVMHIKAPSQWPSHVRRSVAGILGVSADKVVLHESRFFAKNDQLLFLPSFAACVAAVAAVKTQKLVELTCPMTSTMPAMSFQTETVMDSEGNPVIQRSNVTVDMGAFPYFSEEYVRSIVAGCTPVYKLKGLEISVRIMKSPLSPAVFFGDLGYAVSLAATEHHYSIISIEAGSDPAAWRTAHCGACIETVRTSDHIENLPKIIDNCAEASNFGRVYSAYSQPSLHNSEINITPLLGYMRGTGFACGEGVQGFSNLESSLKGFGADIVLYEGGRVEVIGGVAFNESVTDIIEDIILSELDVSRENIVFRNTDPNGELDMGPYVLSRSVCFFPELIRKGCRKIAEDVEEGKPYPISNYVENTFTGDRATTYFNSHTCGCVALTVEMDPVLLVPRVSKVWARLAVGKVFDYVKLEQKARKQITSAINHVLPEENNIFDIDLKITSDPDLKPGSLTSLLRGLTISAVTEAVEQAIGKKIVTIPMRTLTDMEEEDL